MVCSDRRNILRTLALGGVAGLAGCMGDDNSGQTSQQTDVERSVGGEYIVGSQTGVTSLNWITISDQPSADRINLALDYLYAITPEKKIFPLLAEEITTDDDRVYTVTLRDNLKWGSGYGQMTAEDWVYEIKNVFQAEENWSGYTNRSYWFRNNKPIPVDKTGKLSFDIKLPEPDPEYLLRPNLSGAWCMPKGLLKQYVPKKDAEGLKKDKEINELAYTGNLGRYTFERLKQESAFVATRNENYYLHDASGVPEAWTGSPYFDSFTFRVIPEQSTRLSALQEGEVSETTIAVDKAEKFQKMNNITVQIVKQPFLTLLFYNMRKNGWKPFRKQSVRRALSYAVDKKTVAQNIDRGFSEPAHTFQPHWSEWYDDSKVEKTGVGKKYGTQKARSKLKAALKGTGYGYDGETLTGPNGTQVTLKLVITSTSDTDKTLAQYIAKEYGKIGINVSIKPVKFNTLVSKYLENSYQGSGEPKWNVSPSNGGGRDESVSAQSWDMCIGISLNTYPSTPSNTELFFTKKGAANYVGYYPTADLKSLYEEVTTEPDKKKRTELYAEIFGTLSKEQPYNFVTMGVDIHGYQNSVLGPTDGNSPFRGRWNRQTWHLSKQ